MEKIALWKYYRNITEQKTSSEKFWILFALEIFLNWKKSKNKNIKNFFALNNQNFLQKLQKEFRTKKKFPDSENFKNKSEKN